MKKFALPFVIFILTLVAGNAQNTVSLEDMLSEINADSLRKTVVDLENFGSRFALREGGNIEVAEYVANRLNNYGVPATIDSFYQDGNFWLTGPYSQWLYNVNGILEAPQPLDDSIVIIGGHLDAISYNANYQLLELAPGADDNASGIAVMLEIARIFQLHHFVPNRTIHFMAFDGEEIGLLGGYYDAEKRITAQEKIAIMLNNDMVSYQPDNNWQLTLHWYPNATELVQYAAQVCSQYTDIEPFIPTEEENTNSHYSDSYAYYQYGYHPVFAIEHTFSTSYHTDHDLVDSNNYQYHAHVTRYNLAMLYNFAYDVNGTSISENHLNTGVKIYPNPVTDHAMLQFCLQNPSTVTLTFTDMMGKTVQCTQLGNCCSGSNLLEINTSTLPSGFYIARLSTETESMTIKVIKD